MRPIQRDIPTRETRYREPPELFVPEGDAFDDSRYPEGPGHGGRYPGERWLNSMITASFLNVLAGFWLIVAPWVLGYPSSDPRWNDVIFGGAVAALAAVRISGAYRASVLSWVNAAIGIWLIVAGFTIENSYTAGANDVVLGAAVCLLGLWSASASETRPRGTREPRQAEARTSRTPLATRRANPTRGEGRRARP